jgi:glycosyltransferase involved in cell wall biosynthesis
MKNSDTKTINLLDKTYDSVNAPIVSAVVPLFNQENIVMENLTALKNSMSLPWELIIIDDASVDSSLYQIMNWVNSLNHDSKILKRVRVYRNSTELFETRCDIFGFNVATANYLLEIQIDIKIKEKYFDSKLVSAISSYPDMLMISGRGTHKLSYVATEYLGLSESNKRINSNLKIFFFWLIRRLVRSLVRRLPLLFITKNKEKEKMGLNFKNDINKDLESIKSVVFPKLESFINSSVAGLVDNLVEYKCTLDDLLGGQIWLSETVMRGPLLINRIKYYELGGLDERGFFLGHDDHDLSYRAWRDKKWRTGFVPVGFESPLKDGSTRKEKRLGTMIRLLFLRYRTSKNRGKTGLYDFSGKIEVNLPTPEIRKFSHSPYQFKKLTEKW